MEILPRARYVLELSLFQLVPMRTKLYKKPLLHKHLKALEARCVSLCEPLIP